MDDVRQSESFESLHTLQRRLGTARRAEVRPYEPVINGLRSLREGPARRRRFLRLRPRLSRS